MEMKYNQTAITANYGMPDPKQFKDQYKHKYFCDIVQGEVSNDVRLENSVPYTAGLWMPTGSFGYINATGVAVAGAPANTATQIFIPQVVFVGTEHANVASEKFNSGCGLITTIPLNVANRIMTTVYNTAKTYTKGAALTIKALKIDGKDVYGLDIAADSDKVVGIVDSEGPTHYGVRGLVFTACFKA